tara:strand:- start:17538 stop:18215 length:678 start_codon:yes stop_codon:yes gene_type:complete
MFIKYFWLWLIGVTSLIVSGCATTQISKNVNTQQYYEMAISDAAIIEVSEIIPLPVIKSESVIVVSWTKYPNSYPEGEIINLDWSPWVTLDGEVKKACKNFKKNTLKENIQQLLGLPANHDEDRSFVTLNVNSVSIFRPCANPSVTDEKCLQELPKDISLEHAKWFAKQTSKAYKRPEGFPWTRLGYTYNWKAGENEVGLAEFVIKKGAFVKTLSVVDTKTYCSN